MLCRDLKTYAVGLGTPYGPLLHMLSASVHCTDFNFTSCLPRYFVRTLTSSLPALVHRTDFQSSLPVSVHGTDLHVFTRCRSRYTVRTFTLHAVGFGTLYGLLLHTLSASVHLTDLQSSLPASVCGTDLQVFTLCRSRYTVKTSTSSLPASVHRTDLQVFTLYRPRCIVRS